MQTIGGAGWAGYAQAMYAVSYHWPTCSSLSHVTLQTFGDVCLIVSAIMSAVEDFDQRPSWYQLLANWTALIAIGKAVLDLDRECTHHHQVNLIQMDWASFCRPEPPPPQACLPAHYLLL